MDHSNNHFILASTIICCTFCYICKIWPCSSRLAADNRSAVQLKELRREQMWANVSCRHTLHSTDTAATEPDSHRRFCVHARTHTHTLVLRPVPADWIVQPSGRLNLLFMSASQVLNPTEVVCSSTRGGRKGI